MKPCKHYDYVSRFTNPDGSKCLDCGKYLTFDEVAAAAIDKMIKKLEEDLAKENKTPFGGEDYWLP